MKVKGVSPRRLAQLVAVDEKTVGRWLRNLHTQVHEENARRAGDALDCTPHDLWPHRFSAPEQGEPPTDQRPITFNPTMYASRTQVPVAVWQEHFAGATSRIDILVFAATFLFDTVDGFTDLLVGAATRGVEVRFLVGDPAAPNMAIRGEEEGIGASVKARCHNTVEILAPYTKTPGLQIRTHQTTLYTSIFRVDDDVIANFHIYGSPGRNNPVMVFARDDEPRLWATLEQAFTSVWGGAEPLVTASNTSP
jgi:lambda repressor-like predicted transcriptional regulator